MSRDKRKCGMEEEARIRVTFSGDAKTPVIFWLTGKAEFLKTHR